MTASAVSGPFCEVHLRKSISGSNFSFSGPSGPFSNPKREEIFLSKRSDMQINSKQDKYREKVHLVHYRFKTSFRGPLTGGFSCVS
jgi:hypothetical protein